MHRVFSTIRSQQFQRRGKSKPVVGIVGGGPTGLFLSILLSRYNVPSILFERATPDERFRHPQAHFLNTRTMEILRHTVPDIYHDQILPAMPPVEQWKCFRFGANMVDPHAVVVEHPVDRPLQAKVDANGVLVEDMEKRQNQLGHQDLSPVSVGHLAQHKLGRILYNSALAEEHTSIHFGTAVESITPHRQEEGEGVVIHTTNAGSHSVDLCVGADGAHSMVRRSLGIPMLGTTTIQHLINIHVHLPREWAAEHIHHHATQCAMLYSVFTKDAVAMVVCHEIGEYIVQIPYFPPFQTMDGDFGTERMGAILESIFGVPIDPQRHVLSARPWTMGSLVAERFAQDHCILVGDAAHIFPPAGGLGMNTGLQDVHNVAWQIAHSTVGSHRNSLAAAAAAAASYAAERRPIAQQNAALSVRNYQRLLQVTKAAYLDRQHPALLQRILEHSPLPLSFQRQTFRTLLQTALRPFGWMSQHDSMFGQHVRSNVRTTLRSGTGLPLLFPDYEIGFCYGDEATTTAAAESFSEPSTDEQHWLQDTQPAKPCFRVGALVPHTELEVLAGAESFELLQYLSSSSTANDTGRISSVDLPSQLRCQGNPPLYVLLYQANEESSLAEAQALCSSLQTELHSDIRLVVITDAILPIATDRAARNVLQLRLMDSSAPPCFQQRPARAVLIRPDGHIAKIIEE